MIFVWANLARLGLTNPSHVTAGFANPAGAEQEFISYSSVIIRMPDLEFICNPAYVKVEYFYP
ncbi:hypothetical protein QUF80_10625 [Desulfococcaceae bacterium HSG8]|nr:hypothetical protein [Desulfococcaceae bacterium HSG8]